MRRVSIARPTPAGWADVVAHLDVARLVARVRARWGRAVGLTYDDLFQEAVLGMADGLVRPVTPGRTRERHLRYWADQACCRALGRASTIARRDGLAWSVRVRPGVRADRDFRPESVVDTRGSGVDPTRALWHEIARTRRDRLGWTDRVVLALVVLEGYTLTEVGECFGVSRQAISYRVRRAIRTVGEEGSGSRRPLSQRPRPCPGG